MRIRALRPCGKLFGAAARRSPLNFRRKRETMRLLHAMI
jgi:hypothetical protein